MKERVCTSEVEQFTHPKLALNDSFPLSHWAFFHSATWKMGGKMEGKVLKNRMKEVEGWFPPIPLVKTEE